MARRPSLRALSVRDRTTQELDERVTLLSAFGSSGEAPIGRSIGGSRFGSGEKPDNG